MASTDLPAWARISETRRLHAARVTALLDDWSARLGVPAGDAKAWHDAGRYHDVLRDATEAELRAIVPESVEPAPLLHGPAAARMLAGDGERRTPLLEAVTWHTVGHPGWDRTGRALYMADFLEPGRAFARRDRAFLAAQVPTDFDGVFRQVVRMRLEWSLHEGQRLFPSTVDLWNSLS